MKRFVVLVFLFGLFGVLRAEEAEEGRVRTFMKGKIERWDVTLGSDEGNIEAYLMNDPNRWTFEVGGLASFRYSRSCSRLRRRRLMTVSSSQA